MKSMTGFGKREALSQGTMVGVEIRSVNHRFCEIMVRLPKTLTSMELGLKEQIKQVCERGRVELMVTVNGGGTATKKVVQLDRSLARRYVHHDASEEKIAHLLLTHHGGHSDFRGTEGGPKRDTVISAHEVG